MNVRNVLIGFLVCFAGVCGVLVFQSGVFDEASLENNRVISLVGEEVIENVIEDPPAEKVEVIFSKYTAIHAAEGEVTLGSDDPDSGFKFKLELTSKGAAISRATLSEFDDRDRKDPQQLVLLSPVADDGRKIYSLANSSFNVVGEGGVDISRLQWKMGEVVDEADGCQSVEFSTTIIKKTFSKSDPSGEVVEDAVRLTKTYRVSPGSYDVECLLDVKNLLGESIKTQFGLQGPAGIKREGSRQDMRSVVSAFLMSDDKVASSLKDQRKLRKAAESGDKDAFKLRHEMAGAKFMWSAITNKYFTAILRPVPEEGDRASATFLSGRGEYFDKNLSDKPDGDEEISFVLYSGSNELAAKGGSQSFAFQIYLGPKDINVFKDSPLYDALGYIHTISFMACFCCPEGIINPLSFGIISLMKGMYGMMGPFGNYGIVIIIFVGMVRLLLHPITKKSQVSMMSMQKISSHPRMIEIKQKYANNRAEMQKQTMQFYRDENVSPAQGIMGVLPMFLQMPIWIALYRAIYANFELRGAGFLPFWITDLSAQDALFTFPEITVPFVGWHLDSFNFLPVLLGIAMFLQQKLMPHSKAAAQNDQMAQQQKMMMFMMPIMMLVFLYKAPSGLNLYIMASTFAGVFEQIVIRKHIREKEEMESMGLVAVTKKTGGKVKKKKPKPFFKS